MMKSRGATKHFIAPPCGAMKQGGVPRDALYHHIDETSIDHDYNELMFIALRIPVQPDPGTVHEMGTGKRHGGGRRTTTP
ncbi:hypothetical protein JCM14469_30470 [Desulfatiferula olefinivorans]